MCIQMNFANINGKSFLKTESSNQMSIHSFITRTQSHVYHLYMAPPKSTTKSIKYFKDLVDGNGICLLNKTVSYFMYQSDG